MKDVNISYNGVKVLRHIDWTVKKGEHWALLGPNGSGKTTLLSLILGDNPQAYANDINLFGRRKGSGESIWDIKKRIGLVSPELHLHYPRQFSCLDVVCSGFFDSAGLYRRCTDKQRGAALEWMDHMGLSPLAGARFGECSDGAQRMVLVARAMVKHPELLVLDEPCQGLDDRNRHRIVNRVEAIGKHFDTVVIFVTHDPDELPGIVTHVLNLESGGMKGITRSGGLQNTIPTYPT
jgi:molybdate transport system ATP-binding protein